MTELTLKQLAANNPIMSLDDWMALARKTGVEVTPDTPLTAAQRNALKAGLADFIPEKRAAAEKNAAPELDEKRRQASVQNLEKLIRENYIFADASALLSPAGEDFLLTVLPFLIQYKKKLIVPYSVLLKLDRMAKDESDPETAKMCRKRYNALAMLNKEGVVSIRSVIDKCEVPAQELLTACSHYRLNYSLLVLTQDEALAADLMKLNLQQSANGKRITVKRINKHGYLSNVLEKSKEAEKKIFIAEKLREAPDQPLKVTVLPKENDTVYTDPERGNAVRLTECIGGGGEGNIYRTDGSSVAKIYKPECCTAYRKEKIELLMEAGLSYNGICFPTALLYNANGEFVGYRMEEAKGHSIDMSIYRKPLFQKKLPGWKKEDIVQCTITILYKIKYLHDHNIILGDINPGNILIVSPLEVYFVDTDSYQINDMPCPVGFPVFTAPELHQKHRNRELNDYSDVLRTKSNEYFAIATLIFRMMMPGKPPYTQQGGEDIVENILGMHFPYPVGEAKHSKNVPDGTWRFIWSHLTRRMKELFNNIFDAAEGKSEFNIKERLSVDEWIRELLNYQKTLRKWSQELEKFCEEKQCSVEDIEKNTVPGCSVDPQSLDIYPNRLKRMIGVKYGNCKLCDAVYPEEYLQSGICPECLNKGEEVTCIIDGSAFLYTNYAKHVKGSPKPNICPDCRKKKGEIYKSYQCSSPGCYNMVNVTIGDYSYYMSKNYDLPKYCPECKRLRDEQKKKPAPKPVTPAPAPAPKPTPAPAPAPKQEPAPATRSPLEAILRAIFKD